MGISQNRRRRLQAVAAQSLLGITGLALITFVCFQLDFGVARTGFAFVILIALVSLLGSFSASVNGSAYVLWRGRNLPATRGENRQAVNKCPERWKC
jgi:hypothetical protein